MAEREERPIEGLGLCGAGIINGVKTAEPCQRKRGGGVSFVRGPRRDLMEKEGRGKGEGGGEEI